MTRIAHIVHPGDVPPTSDLTIAQPVTFESMLIAQEFARAKVDVDLVAVKHHDETPVVPSGFSWVPDLTRSVLDVGRFKIARKLALLDDILRRLYEHSDADYLVYSNVDIALQPPFYVMVKSIIDGGHDAFSINRRTIPDHYTSPEELPLMWAEIGRPHPGHDCFIFPRQAYAQYNLGQVCIGSSAVGRVTLWNMICFAKRFHRFTDLHATFHIGDTQVWRTARTSEYMEFNRAQARQVHAFLQPHAAKLDTEVPHGKYIRQLQRPFEASGRTNRLLYRARRLAKSVLATLPLRSKGIERDIHCEQPKRPADEGDSRNTAQENTDSTC